MVHSVVVATDLNWTSAFSERCSACRPSRLSDQAPLDNRSIISDTSCVSQTHYTQNILVTNKKLSFPEKNHT